MSPPTPEDVCTNCGVAGYMQEHGCVRCIRMKNLDQIPKEFVTWAEDVAKTRAARLETLAHKLWNQLLETLKK